MPEEIAIVLQLASTLYFMIIHEDECLYMLLQILSLLSFQTYVGAGVAVRLASSFCVLAISRSISFKRIY